MSFLDRTCVMSPAVQEGEPERTEQTDVAVIEVDPQPDPSLPRAIILDLSPVNFLDTVGVKTLSRVRARRSHDLIRTSSSSIFSAACVELSDGWSSLTFALCLCVCRSGETTVKLVWRWSSPAAKVGPSTLQEQSYKRSTTGGGVFFFYVGD